MTDDGHHRMPRELEEALRAEDAAERKELSALWELLGNEEHPVSGAPDADEAWAGVEARTVGAEQRAPDRPARRKTRRSYVFRGWAIAATVALLALLGGALWWSQPAVVEAPPGEHLTHQLPDGSEAELSGGSTLSYRRGFTVLPFIPEQERTVSAEGEIFFDVEEGERPFAVETFNARIEVLGTRFNVQAEAGETRVTLAEGRVRLAARRADAEEVLLEEVGQSSRIRGEGAVPSPPQAADLDQVLAWRSEGFYAWDQPLWVIITRLERRYGVDLHFEIPAIASDAMTLFYSRAVGLETVLDDICMAKGCRYRPTSQGFEIVPEETER